MIQHDHYIMNVHQRYPIHMCVTWILLFTECVQRSGNKACSTQTRKSCFLFEAFILLITWVFLVKVTVLLISCTAGVGVCTGHCTAGVGVCIGHCTAGVGVYRSLYSWCWCVYRSL